MKELREEFYTTDGWEMMDYTKWVENRYIALQDENETLKGSRYQLAEACFDMQAELSHLKQRIDEAPNCLCETDYRTMTNIGIVDVSHPNLIVGRRYAILELDKEDGR